MNQQKNTKFSELKPNQMFRFIKNGLQFIFVGKSTIGNLTIYQYKSKRFDDKIIRDSFKNQKVIINKF